MHTFFSLAQTGWIDQGTWIGISTPDVIWLDAYAPKFLPPIQMGIHSRIWDLRKHSYRSTWATRVHSSVYKNTASAFYIFVRPISTIFAHFIYAIEWKPYSSWISTPGQVNPDWTHRICEFQRMGGTVGRRTYPSMQCLKLVLAHRLYGWYTYSLQLIRNLSSVCDNLMGLPNTSEEMETFTASALKWDPEHHPWFPSLLQPPLTTKERCLIDQDWFFDNKFDLLLTKLFMTDPWSTTTIS